MRAGKLNKRVELQMFAEATASDGGQAKTWSTITTVWASIESMNGDEATVDSKLTGVATYKFRIRHNSSVSVNRRIKYGTRVFDIKHVDNWQERNIFQDLTCTEALNV